LDLDGAAGVRGPQRWAVDGATPRPSNVYRWSSAVGTNSTWPATADSAMTGGPTEVFHYKMLLSASKL
jgi:hypothetical protein